MKEASQYAGIGLFDDFSQQQLSQIMDKIYSDNVEDTFETSGTSPAKQPVAMTTEVKLCECGCGKPAPIAKWNDRSYGWEKGQSKRFVKGHAGATKEHNMVKRHVRQETRSTSP